MEARDFSRVRLHIKQLGSSYMDTVQNRQYYRVVSSAFTQREIMHLACNMYSLYNIGQILVLMTTSKRIDSIGHFTGLLMGLICGGVLINIFRF